MLSRLRWPWVSRRDGEIKRRRDQGRWDLGVGAGNALAGGAIGPWSFAISLQRLVRFNFDAKCDRRFWRRLTNWRTPHKVLFVICLCDFAN